jgi:hypothetical protein
MSLGCAARAVQVRHDRPDDRPIAVQVFGREDTNFHGGHIPDELPEEQLHDDRRIARLSLTHDET